MVKGNKTVQNKTEVTKYVGFTGVEVSAINPTRSELNKLLGKEDSENDTEIDYKSVDQEGNDRLRLAFWLYDAKIDKYFPYSFNLTKKERVSKDGLKNQYVNSVALTAWADDEKNLQEWFLNAVAKDKTVLGEREVRRAILGEEELATLLRSWLGRLAWNDPETSVMVDLDKLFNEDYSELRSLINSDYDTPFLALTGVKTDENDSTKQYQQIYGKSFLPIGFLQYIASGSFKTEYAKKTWNRFVDEVEGPYGFTSYFKLAPLAEYDKDEDVAAHPTTAVNVTNTNAKY